MTQIHDPFARPVQMSTTDVRMYNHSYDLGETTMIDDKFDEERRELQNQGVIPSEATTEDGYNTMMKILHSQSELKSLRSQSSASTSVGEQVPPKQPTSSLNPSEGGDSTVFSPPSNPPNPFAHLNAPDKAITDSNDVVSTPGEQIPEKVHFEDNEVLPILDAILTSGYAKETYTIRNAKLVLRTQFFWEDQFVVEKTDELAASTHLKPSMNFYLQVYALAANLESFGSAVFPVSRMMNKEEQRKSFEERLDYLGSLPSVIVDILYRKRAEFIQKIAFIQENFDRLIKVF